MRRAIKFLFGATIGGLVGAGVVLLLTPASGQELRTQMQDQVQRIQAEIQEAAAARRSELEGQLRTLRQPQKGETKIEI